MGGMIRADTALLERTKDGLKGYVREIRSEVMKLGADASWMPGVWEGSAYEALHSNFSADIRILEACCRQLDAVAAYEENAIREYGICKRRIAAITGSLIV